MTYSLRFSEDYNQNETKDASELKANQLKANFYCIHSKNETQVTVSDKLSRKVDEEIRCADSIREQPFWRSINNSFAIIVICFASFIWGFYA